VLSLADAPVPVAQRQVPTTLNQADRLALACGPDHWRKRPVTFGLQIRGCLDPGLLELALTWTARRHSALRTYFPYVPETDRALCLDPGDVGWPLDVTDLSRMPPDARAAAEHAAVVALIDYFDPAIPPLFRGILLKQDDDMWLAGLAADHLVFDGASIPFFFRDLENVYGHLLSGGNATDLACEVSDYSLFCAAERAWLTSPAAEHAISCWEPLWDGMGPSPDLALPTIKPGTEQPSGHVWRQDLPAAAIARTRRRFPDGHLSLFAIAAGCVISTLRDVTGRTDCGIVHTTSRRSWPGTDQMIGCMMNRVLLRVDTAGAASPREVIGLTRNAILDSMEHTIMPFEFLINRFSPDLAGRRPQNPHVVVDVDSEPGPPRLGDLEVSMAWPVAGDAFRDDPRVMISLQPSGPDSVTLCCGYQASLFDRDFIGSFMTRVARLLTSASG
jgi:hypothetical protein